MNCSSCMVRSRSTAMGAPADANVAGRPVLRFRGWSARGYCLATAAGQRVADPVDQPGPGRQRPQQATLRWCRRVRPRRGDLLCLLHLTPKVLQLLLGEQLHLLVGSTVHLLELREDVVYFPVLLGEERDYVSRCGGCRHVRGCTRPPAQRNEMPGCAGVKRHQSKPAICSCKYASVW